MSAARSAGEAVDSFAGSRNCFEELLGWLDADQAAGLTHAELEEQLDHRGRELVRRIHQDQLELRALREQRVEVTDAEGVGHNAVETGHARPLSTLFGTVTVTRMAYRHRGHANLFPADAGLNLPGERHSHGLRKLTAIEAPQGSFEQASDAIGRRTGTAMGKRQVESLTARAAADVEDFYATRRPPAGEETDLLVISADGKGIVMRPESLRPGTAAKAAAASGKLTTRLSKGEKRNRRRLAEVGTVYDLTPAPRTVAEVMGPRSDEDQQPPAGPKPHNKWVTASVVDDAAEVLAGVLDEAERRDPTTNGPGSRWWTATTTRSTGSSSKPQPAASRSPS